MINKKRWVIGLIVILVIGGSIGGKLLYDAKKERDRQELIHMGDRLRDAQEKYDKTIEEINQNYSMAEEYTELMISINDSAVPTSELKGSIDRACELEEKLMETYPSVYTESSELCK